MSEQWESVLLESSINRSTVQHLICIGDPQQLRPTLANFCQSDGQRPIFNFTDPHYQLSLWIVREDVNCTNLTVR